MWGGVGVGDGDGNGPDYGGMLAECLGLVSLQQRHNATLDEREVSVCLALVRITLVNDIGSGCVRWLLVVMEPRLAAGHPRVI